MKLVFCGTPRFAVPTLERLVEAGYHIPLVITQPDRARGRGMEVAVSPVKESAASLGIDIIQPQSIKNNVEFRDRLTAIAPDAIIVVGYGRIIPQWMIDLPQTGKFEPAWLAPTKIQGRGADPVGDRVRRINHRCHHDADRRWPRYWRYIVATRTHNFGGGYF